MLKKFINGLVFGAGFGIALSVVGLVAFYIVLPKVIEGSFSSGTYRHKAKETSTVPVVPKASRFLGTIASHSGDFKNEGVLTGGPGEIVGKAFVNGKLLSGLKLRLALNGSVMSQWAETDVNGKYHIRVPYGEYIVDGFELDGASANQVLPNKIHQSHFPHSNIAFSVSAGSTGRGMDFFFVDPVIKLPGKTQFSASDDIVLEWQAYPGATDYSVQLLEKAAANSWNNKRLFEWSDKPKVLEAKINLSDYGVKLKPGYFYLLEVEARDQQRTTLSQTAQMFSGYDFEVIE